MSHRNFRSLNPRVALHEHEAEEAATLAEIIAEAKAEEAEEEATTLTESEWEKRRKTAHTFPVKVWQSPDTNVLRVRVGEDNLPDLLEQLDWELSRSNRPHHPPLSNEDHRNLVDRR